MAAISVSANTFLDTASGTRAGGDTVSFTNASTFTIRTDTRWYAGAPASSLGSLGSITILRGAKLHVDGTKVRWMPFGGASGTVPAINTTITQGTASGTLLGVWSSITSVPVAVGAAMPASGFIKFREVTNTFSTGPLSGISASASGPDVVGWIEIVMDSGSTIINAPNGDGIVFTGDWFNLGTTTGIAGQTFTFPTVGGGTSACHGVQIETAPNSGIYEWFPSLLTSDKFTSAFMSQDIRSKFVNDAGNNIVRLGSDGTTAMGYLPPSGCKVRIPNILFRFAALATRSTNSLPTTGTRPAFNSGAATKVNIDKAHLDFGLPASSSKSIILTNSITENAFTFSDCKFVDINSSCFSQYSTTNAVRLTLTRCDNINIDYSKFSMKTGYILGALRIESSQNISSTSTELIVLGAQSISNIALAFNICSNAVFTNIKLKGGTVNGIKCSNMSFINLDYCDNTAGTTATTSPGNLFVLDVSDDITIDGLSYGESGAIANTHHYGTIYSVGTNGSSNIKIRNIGTADIPLDCGTNPTFYPQQLLGASAISKNVKIQKVYFSGFRTQNIPLASPFLPNAVIESLYLGNTASFATIPAFSDSIVRNYYINITLTAPISLTTGIHWLDSFSPSTTATTGQLIWIGATPSSTSASFNSIISTSQYAGYTGTGVALGEINDEAYSEMEYFMYGHTGFQNVEPIISGNNTGSYSIYYQIDIGTGFNGTWNILNATKLSGETVNPAGTKLKLKFVLISTTGVTTSQITAIKIQTITEAAARSANQYPLDTTSLGFSNLQPGSEVRAYIGEDPSTSVEIGGIESTAGTTFSFTHDKAGEVGYIMIFAMGYQPIYLPYTFTAIDTTILIQQTIDRNYTNPI